MGYMLNKMLFFFFRSTENVPEPDVAIVTNYNFTRI